jgi:RNase adaptor protein for sRNA GlmZ degradation
MKDTNLSKGHLFLDKVDVYLNVLHATMLDGIGRHVNSTYVITIDNSGCLHRKVQILEKLAQPAAFSDNMGHRSIFCLSTRLRNFGVAL